MKVSAERIRQQIAAILTAWGMDADLIRSTTEVMVETDLAKAADQALCVYAGALYLDLPLFTMKSTASIWRHFGLAEPALHQGSLRCGTARGQTNRIDDQ